MQYNKNMNHHKYGKKITCQMPTVKFNIEALKTFPT